MAQTDLYKMLGLGRDASASDIKKAYRKLAKKYHPDTNQNSPSAEKHFKDISQAYAILGDEKKKKIYDSYGMAPFESGMDPEEYVRNLKNHGGHFGGENYGGHFGGSSAGSGDFSWHTGGFAGHGGGAYGGFGGFSGGDASGGFGGFSGGSASGGFGGFSGGDASGGFEGFESFSGGSEYVNMDDLLGNLFGHAKFGHRSRSDFGEHFKNRDVGSDEMHAELDLEFEEAALGGEREILLSVGSSSSRLKIQVPAGIGEGQSIRLRGQGGKRRDGSRGDLLVKVHILPHAKFRREDRDIYSQENIPYKTAVLGGSASFDTLYGKVSCRIPAGTQCGSKIRLKGKGIVNMKDHRSKGDMYVTIGIEVPKHLTKHQRELLDAL